MSRRERLEAKLEKRQEWAEKAKARSEARIDAVQRLADQIPLGQPILVGHHSERHARRDAARIRSGMEKGIALQKLAAHHEGKADGLERALDTSIFSDDADAIEALRTRIEANRAERDRRKAINALYRKGDAGGLAAMGLDLEKLRNQLCEFSLCDRQPWPSYSLTNLGARISADEKRIEEIQRRAARAARAEAAGGVVVDGDGDYVRVTFAEKPDRSVLDALKAAGFVWTGGSWCGRRDRLPESIGEVRS